MVLSANAEIERLPDRELREYPVGAAVHVYKTALVGIDPAGYVKAFEPGDLFVGIAYEAKDNSAGAAGALNVRVFVETDFLFTLTGVVEADKGKAVFATADDAIALTGHPDAYVGRVLGKHATNKAVIRMKQPGEKPLPSDTGCIEIVSDFAEPVTPTGAAGGGTETFSNGLRLVSALGLGVKNISGANGGAQLEFDAIAEIAQASIECPEIFTASGGVTFESRMHLSDIGDDTALDVDWGLATVIDGTTRADLDDATVTDLALFHMDGADANVYAQSDDNTTDVAPTDTGVNNALDAYKLFKIIVRPAGTVEFWIDGVRMLSTTAFAVRAAAVLGALINIEKTANDTLAVVKIDRIRVAGARV